MNPLPRVHKQGNNNCPYSKVGTMREDLSLSLSLSSEKGGLSNDRFLLGECKTPLIFFF
jgi:hypothetical protein